MHEHDSIGICSLPTDIAVVLLWYLQSFQQITINGLQNTFLNNKANQDELTHKTKSESTPVDHQLKSQSHLKERDNVLALLFPKKSNGEKIRSLN
jgi:hypothetical protein